eukprot:CFRG4696T1
MAEQRILSVEVPEAALREPEFSQSRNYMRRMYDDVVGVIKAGITVKKLSLSVAFGISCGLFPIPGATAIACFIASLIFGLNKIIIQVINLALTAIEILCIPFFSKFGSLCLGKEPVQFDVSDIVAELKKDFFGTFVTFGNILGRAVFGWSILFIPISCLVFVLVYPILHYTLPTVKVEYRSFEDEDNDEEGLVDCEIGLNDEPHHADGAFVLDTPVNLNEHEEQLKVEAEF